MAAKDDPNLLKLACSVADGTAVEDEGADPSSGNLRRLAGLAQMFSQCREQDAEPPFRWAGLEVESVLGRGGFGTVYRARDPVLSRHVALKLIDRGALADAEFMAEARRLARVSHPNVLTIHGVEESDGRVGLWADLLEGQTLEQRLAHGPIDSSTLLSIAGQLAEALRAVHAAGLVHGDVKASNVMLDEDGHVTLMDFGAAYLDDGGSPRFGSPVSLAPEVLENGWGSPQADLYSLGVLLYRAASGRLPHVAEGRDALLEQKRNVKPDESALVQLPRSLRRLIVDLLDSQPDKRPDAAEVVERLGEIRELPRRRLRRVAVGSVVAALAVGLIVASIAFVEVRRAQQQAEGALQRVESINALLTDLLASPRPTEAGEQITVREALAQFEPRLETALTDQPTARARLLRTVGKTYLQLGESDLARSYLEESLTLEEAGEPIDYVGLLTSTELLARVELDAGRPETALEMMEAAIARAQRQLPGDHELHVQLAVTRSHAHQRLTEPDAARTWAERAVEASESTEWHNPGNRVLAPLRMTNVLLAGGDVQAAESWARQALSAADEWLPERNSNALAARSLLAEVLVRTGRAGEALPLARELVTMAGDWLGPDHPRTVPLRNLLAIALGHQGRYAEAETVLDGLIAVQSERLGPLAPGVFSLHINRANARRYQGFVGEAIADYRDILAAARQEHGELAGFTRVAHANLCEALLENDAIEAARREAQAALNIAQEAFGPDHSFALHARMVRAATDAAGGQPDRAVESLTAVIDRLSQAMGDQAPMTLQGRGYLAGALRAAGRPDEGAQTLAAARASAREALGERHRITRQLDRLAEETAL